jgi:hypothetical protein
MDLSGEALDVSHSYHLIRKRRCGGQYYGKVRWEIGDGCGKERSRWLHVGFPLHGLVFLSHAEPPTKQGGVKGLTVAPTELYLVSISIKNAQEVQHN